MIRHITRLLTMCTAALIILCTAGLAADQPQNNPPDQKRPPRGDGPSSRQRQDGNRQQGPQKYSLEQAISDNAQLHTIAFDGLAFMTSNFCSDTFIPPGKVSDYFGFQYMRDIDAGERGHNTSFLTRVASNVIYTLNDEQKAKFIALGKEQEGQIRELALKRLPLIKSFCRQLEGDIPKGSEGLSREAVKEYSGKMWELDGTIACERAKVTGAIIQSLDEKQKAYLGKLKFGDYRTWPDIPEQLDKRSMSHGTHVAVMTYASEMFSWYAGSVEADVYFCPERHGTYFGSFYLKDMPAMGKKDYSISTSLTGDSGENFLAILTTQQRQIITSIVDLQRSDLAEIVKIRREISIELRKFIQGQTADKEKVLALSHRYGELDGEMSWYYATGFAKAYKTLSAEQKVKLMKLRNLDDYPCSGAFIYSERVSEPEMVNTDFLFAAIGK
jgi:Spy/CpxP family protein refolding chaperone